MNYQKKLVFLRLIEIYEKYGLEVKTGLNSFHFNNYSDAPSTVISQKGKILGLGGDGISPQEVLFFECLFFNYNPKNIFIIGNGYSWSSIMFSLLNPPSMVVAIDHGFNFNNDHSDIGINLTNQIAKNEKLNLKVVKGSSPQDIKTVVKNVLKEDIDFAFIDGSHTEKQIGLDFAELFKFSSSNKGIFTFHDILNFNLENAFYRIAKKSKLNSKILYRTQSGIGILYPTNINNSVKIAINGFCEKKEVINSIKKISNHPQNMYVHIIQNITPPFVYKILKSLLKIIK